MSRAIRIGGALLASSAAFGLVVEGGDSSRSARLLLEAALVVGVVVWGVGRIVGELGSLVRRPVAATQTEEGAEVIDLHPERAGGAA